MVIEKDGVTLRLFKEEDIEQKVEWINNPANNEFLHYDIPISLEGTMAWYKNKSIHNRLDCVIEWQGIPVGLIGLLQIDNVNRKAEYYITIGNTAYKRKGIALKATELIITYAFEVLKLKKIYLNVDEKNLAACLLYEKAGFKCEGIFIEDMLFKGEWINRRRYAIINGTYGN